MSRRSHLTAKLVTLGLITGLIAGLVVGCSPTDDSVNADSPSSADSATTSVQDEQEKAVDDITAMLERRADAVSKGNRKAFLRSVDKSEKKYAAKQRTLFGNLDTLPIHSFEYRTPAADDFDLSDFSDRRISAEIVEDVRIKGADRAPVSNSLPMAFVRKRGKWVLTAGGDSGVDRGDVQSRPWSGAPIAVARSGKAVVVVDKELEDRLAGLVASLETEIPSIAETLDLEPRFDLLVDATSSGRRSRLGGKGKDAASAAAFTVYTRDQNGQRETRPAGQRIKLDPLRVEELIDSRVLLRHELSHFLTKGTTDAPQWIEEGLAEYVSYYPTRPSGLVVPAVTLDRILGLPRALPRTVRFGRDADADYLIAHSATTYLVDTFGMEKFTRFRLSYENGLSDPDKQTRQRVRKVFQISEDELLERTWAKLSEFHRG